MESLHWKEYFTEDTNIPYYYSKVTKNTQWEKPPEIDYCNYGSRNSKNVIGNTNK